MSTTAVPVFKLYGETRHWPTPDLLHWESIPERSRLHDWRIRPHRHTDLLHLLHLSSGRVSLELEGSLHAHDAPLVIVVPAMSIHGFHFSPDTLGHIITLARPLTDRLEERLGGQAAVLSRATAHPLEGARQAGRIATLVDQIGEEYCHPAPGRERLLEAFTEALFIEISRLADKRAAAGITKRLQPQHRGLAHLQNYQALIEKQFRQQPSVERFAEQLGMTSAHLNLLCRRLADRSALQLLHERLLLEAKRQLTYTNMTIGQVADSLGFSEPAYFTRFFKRLTGLSPRDFRQRQSGT
ncbi:MAG: helix-turn-helix domain-containing protein [Halomonas sp.]|uniref:helix-turn-helix domain-containing protein n=1 Tax=Halomonas sp. TaxID=1486246 RepID=UPI0028703B86|nr:helix-turn-helix domain-containing protein [Halomonas sp.]MDR9440279.1 helix-turn-helix domain-containing protein [Halomonas sp.]